MEAIQGLISVAMALSAAGAFYSMGRGGISQALAMPLLACLFLTLNAPLAEELLVNGAKHAAPVLALFTGVAVPAHLIGRSGGFSWLAAELGRRIGFLFLSRPGMALPTLIASLLAITFVTAGLMHNVTSILVMTPIAIGLCRHYDVTSRWLLSSMLIASNLGGFSTAWGDTPNIVEARVWGLTALDFTREILPVNIVILGLLYLLVLTLTRVTVTAGRDKVDVANTVTSYGLEKNDIRVDGRMLFVGSGLLMGTVSVTVLFPASAVGISAFTVLAATLLVRGRERLDTLLSLGFETYLVLFSVFVIAAAVEHSALGAWVQELIRTTGGAPWAIAVGAFLGTATTEAASWASAASGITYQMNSSHAAAWALGGGICAGSSALITAASAGVILASESRRVGGAAHELTFASYLTFGVPFSIVMLAIYATVFTVWP